MAIAKAFDFVFFFTSPSPSLLRNRHSETPMWLSLLLSLLCLFSLCFFISISLFHFLRRGVSDDATSKPSSIFGFGFDTSGHKGENQSNQSIRFSKKLGLFRYLFLLLFDALMSRVSKKASFCGDSECVGGDGEELGGVDLVGQEVKRKKKRGKKKKSGGGGGVGGLQSEDVGIGESELRALQGKNEGKNGGGSDSFFYPFTSSSSATQRKIKAQYDQIVKSHDSKALTLSQVTQFVNCLVEARNDLQHKSEIIQRRFTIVKALLYKTDRSSLVRFSQQMYKLEAEQKRLEEDTLVYNRLQEQLKLSPAYKQMIEIGARMEQKASSDKLVDATDAEFASISFEELLAQEKKDTFWQRNGKLRSCTS
ncbi:hypothetical protein Scep_007806 [Stephania cephalantha]|uniref:Uncharacterized protein n=1 Tax=Stephania cephalantha TaxID=152367 RepID=A0AAP0PNK9_9MAGN